MSELGAEVRCLNREEGDDRHDDIKSGCRSFLHSELFAPVVVHSRRCVKLRFTESSGFYWRSVRSFGKWSCYSDARQADPARFANAAKPWDSKGFCEVVEFPVGDVAQLVRALPCHGRGRGFEPRRPRHSFQEHSRIDGIPILGDV